MDARRVLTPSGWSGPSRIRVDDGVVVAVDPVDHVATDRSLVPGFVDLQVFF